MTISRLPHPIFAALWLLWSFGLFFVSFYPSPRAWLALWASFFAIEGTAAMLNTGKRDTLSELVTWVHRKLAKGPAARIPYRGWNALLFAPYIGLIGFNVARMFGGRGDVIQGFGVVFACVVSIGLWDHFVAPEIHG